MPLNNRVVIVTGAGGGLGACHAAYLAQQGAHVVVNDQHADAATAVAERIVAAGGSAIALAASVTDSGQVAGMAGAALDHFGRIDILINNAGILRDKSFTKMSLNDFRLVVDVHLMGSVICTKAVWDTMRAQGYGRIVMTTSSSGLYGNFGQANYAAAKMALVGLMQTLGIEGARNNIRVNCLAPTAATQMTDGVLSAEALASLDPALVSPALLSLVSEDAPTRTILCAGAGHFAEAHITLTPGIFIGAGADAGDQVVAQRRVIADREGALVPAYGFMQAERELASAGLSAPAMAIQR
jgi:NAD(P)-dependent dehydrogenase (short-subunit alcohol dehydrogenase family)